MALTVSLTVSSSGMGENWLVTAVVFPELTLEKAEIVEFVFDTINALRAETGVSSAIVAAASLRQVIWLMLLLN